MAVEMGQHTTITRTRWLANWRTNTTANDRAGRVRYSPFSPPRPPPLISRGNTPIATSEATNITANDRTVLGFQSDLLLMGSVSGLGALTVIGSSHVDPEQTIMSCNRMLLLLGPPSPWYCAPIATHACSCCQAQTHSWDPMQAHVQS
jgi:hypothetical protein